MPPTLTKNTQNKYLTTSEEEKKKANFFLEHFKSQISMLFRKRTKVPPLARNAKVFMK